MQKIIYILTFFLINFAAFAQGTTLNNTGGKLNNLGTIKVKSGQVVALPDTLGGRIEFLQNIPTGQQVIPNIVYNQLVIKNKSKKIVSDQNKNGVLTKNLTVLDSLIVDDSTEFTSRWIGFDPEDVHAKASVTNNAEYKGKKYIVLNGEKVSQDLQGKGSFSNLMIDNPIGVNVINGGGFDIRESLVLKSGTLNNDAENNFSMSDTSEIIRFAGAELNVKPQFGSEIKVRYRGEGAMLTSGELPEDESNLTVFDVANVGGLDLAHNVLVSDSIYVYSDIRTGSDTLTLTSLNDPEFNPNYEEEIEGTFRRNNLVSGDTLLYNNPYTYAHFADDSDLNGIQDMAMTVTPRQHPDLPLGDEKVDRTFILDAWDKDGNRVEQDMNVDFGYGWRHKPGENEDESNNLNIQDLVLQRWIGNTWFDYEGRQADVDNNGWAYNNMPRMSKLGTFGIGVPGGTSVLFSSRALLEGPYIPQSDGLMFTNLLERGLLRFPPSKDEYPLNLDPNYNPDSFTAVPDSVVDWIVLEFREERNSDPSAFKTGFIRYDGAIVDMNGNNALTLTNKDGIDSGGGSYYVVLRHRNHNPVISSYPVNIYPETSKDVFDFTKTDNVEGGFAALKLLEITADDRRIWGLRGGYFADSNNEDAISRLIGVLNYPTLDEDQKSAWNMFTREGYLLQDYDLNGIVTTQDFNVSWNNR